MKNTAIGDIYNIPRPFALFITSEKVHRLKHATVLVHWAPEQINCVLDHKDFSGIDFGFSVKNVDDAVSNGAKTLLICNYPNVGPKDLSGFDFNLFKYAMSKGMHIANGLHDRLSNYDELVEHAIKCGVYLYDFRHPPIKFSLGTGRKRSGLRLLTMGTDCICGKKFTSLALSKLFKQNSIKSTFRSTGQSGFLISSGGINNDTVVADFLTGAAEFLSPDNDPDHWDIIEGQGSILHPAFCGGTHSLLYGSQPDVIVMCHDPFRDLHLNQNTPIVNIYEQMKLCETIGKYSNENCHFKAISLFTGNVSDDEALDLIYKYKKEASEIISRDLYVFDPNKQHIPEIETEMIGLINYCKNMGTKNE